jgi:hypothetical protein
VELTGARPKERRVAPVVGLVGTGRRGEARGRSGGGAYRHGVERGGGADGVDGARLAASRWLMTCAEDGGER